MAKGHPVIPVSNLWGVAPKKRISNDVCIRKKGLEKWLTIDTS